MGRVVAGFSVPHTPYLPMTIPKGGPDAGNGPLYERIRQELEDTRVSLELLRNSRLIRATRPARLLYHRLRRR